MPAVFTKERSRCIALESPKRSYDALLVHISDNLGENDIDGFQFAFRNELPKTVLELRKPLKWFSKLEQRNRLSPGNLSCLVDFLQLFSLNLLLKEVNCYEARRRLVVFLQRRLEEEIPELCLESTFNRSWRSDTRLPRHFLRRCNGLFRPVRKTGPKKYLLRLLSGGVKLLVSSCRPHLGDLDIIAIMVVHLSNLFYDKFGEMIIEHRDLLTNASCPSNYRCRRVLDAERQQQVACSSERPRVEILIDLAFDGKLYYIIFNCLFVIVYIYILFLQPQRLFRAFN